MKSKKKLYLDIAERTFWTFTLSFLAIVTATGGAFTWLTLKSAAIAAAYTVVKGFGASKIGNSDTAQAMPGATYTNDDGFDAPSSTP